MSTPNVQPDQAWGTLVNAAGEEREGKMAQRYKELSALSEEEKVSQMIAMTKAEYDLADAELRIFTLSRLRTWLKLDEDVARGIATSYDAAMLNMPGPVAMRRVSLVQNLSREFPREDQVRLAALIPNMFAGFSDLLQPVNLGQTQTPVASAAPAKKGWWPFKKG